MIYIGIRIEPVYAARLQVKGFDIVPFRHDETLRKEDFDDLIPFICRPADGRPSVSVRLEIGMEQRTEEGIGTPIGRNLTVIKRISRLCAVLEINLAPARMHLFPFGKGIRTGGRR